MASNWSCPSRHLAIASAIAVLLLLTVAGCGSSGDRRTVTPTASASATRTAPPTPTPTEPVLCSVYGAGSAGCPEPTLAPCTGAMLTNCSMYCGGANPGCCTLSNPPGCFPSGGVGNTQCKDDLSMACLVVATPTGTATTTPPTSTATPIQPTGTPPPTLGPCTGATLTLCQKNCSVGQGCCPLPPGQTPACFPDGNPVGTNCQGDNFSQACLVVGTPTATGTGTATATPTVTLTPTPTDTPQGGIPTPTLAPGTCDAMCEQAAPPPSPCATLPPNGGSVGDNPPDLIVDTCQVVGSGLHVYGYVNVIDGGTLYFADDGGQIDFRANSILVQQGGTVRAGAWCCPFGSYGGTLDIGLWGSDPTGQGKTPTPTTAGIDCVDASGNATHCFSPQLVATSHYCTVSGSDDPCSSTVAPSVGDNALFQGSTDHGGGGLPFDAGAPFGYKVLAVTYGGSLELFGAKGVAATDRTDPSLPDTTCAVPTPSAQDDPTAWAALSGGGWARLDATAPAASSSIAIDRVVNWQQGDKLVVASTDWHASHSEQVVIAGITGPQTFELNAPLDYGHYGEIYDVAADIPTPPSANQQVDTRAAVGLLSRDIRVYSLGDTYDQPLPAAADCGYQGDASGNATTPPDCYFGGHVIARQGFENFQVQGVEFEELGQGGRLAHYPVHFHLAKSTAYTNAFLKDSSIHSSMNRFVTIHGTHDVTIARNVGFLSVGHGYYIEDGAEIDNLLCHNLAVSVRGSLVEYFQAQAPWDPTYRFSPPILPSVQSGPPYGGDGYMPVGFWTMNTWNELVGNKVVGVGGYGSCYWLLGSGVSGPSAHLSWSDSTTSPDGYADYNQASTRQAPLKRFRGNSCSTSQYALQTTLSVDPPPTPAIPQTYGYTAVNNPYAITTDMLPEVAGDYLPVLIGGDACATQRTAQDAGSNTASCSLTLIDRFTTSFNWAPIDFGAIWLRPQFFAFVNGAVTDQLFGGLTFVSGGAWTQAPPGYFTITKDSIYAGTTQPDGVSDAGRAGPAFDIDLCKSGACPLPVDGTALFTQGFQPKRLINIYDGPFFAEGNAFTNAEPFECDPTQAPGGNPECGIYFSTVQPATCAAEPDPDPALDNMCVMNAAVGWKQPNGFYYPPAFAFENSAFDTETTRHNVVDQYNSYIQGNPASLNHPSTYVPLQTYTGITPIDFSTILNDLDGTFTGNCWGDDCDMMSLPSPQRQTSSVSANHFFDSPSRSPECLSSGVQTSPNEFLTTVIAPVTADGTAIDPSVWGTFPAVPIYRQRLLTSEAPCTGAICDGDTWSCPQATFMMGAENGQAPYLMASDGVYYIDTDATSQSTSCIAQPTTFELPTFSAGSQYVLYQLFARSGAKTRYQLYTGCTGEWVWVLPHLTVAGEPSNNLAIEPIDDPTLVAALNSRLTQHPDGVLEIEFDSNLIADQFEFTTRADEEKCVPRDACQIAADGSQCALSSSFAEPDLAETVGAICGKWATRVAGTTPASQGLSLSDCPASGCLGYRFELPSSWTPKSYGEVGASHVTCFPDDAQWNRPLQVISQDAEVCPVPPTPSGFGDNCQDPIPVLSPSCTPTITPTATQTPTPSRTRSLTPTAGMQ